MESSRVIIVSDSPLFVDAVSRLLEEQDIHVIAKTSDPEEVRELLDSHQVDAIVVDQDSVPIQRANTMSHIMNYQEERPVIFLTLADNQMIVHHQERVRNVTPADLVGAIRSSK